MMMIIMIFIVNRVRSRYRVNSKLLLSLARDVCMLKMHKNAFQPQIRRDPATVCVCVCVCVCV